VETTLIGEGFFREHVRTGGSSAKAGQGGGMGFGLLRARNPFDDEDELQIANAVYVCIVRDFVILLKENWEKWTFMKESKELKRHKKNREKADDGNKAGSTPAGGGENPLLVPPKETKDRDEAEIRAFGERVGEELKRRHKHCGLFELISCVPVGAVLSLQIHRGKDPSVNLSCFNARNEYTMKILFTGDMERQKFVEALIHRRRRGVAEEEDEDDDDDDVDKGAAEARSNDSWED